MASTAFGVLSSTLRTLLGSPPGNHVRDDAQLLEQIQQTMLQAIAPVEPDPFVGLHRRIRFAEDLQALWYMRPDLLAALASIKGEACAASQLNEITSLFPFQPPRLGRGMR